MDHGPHTLCLAFDWLGGYPLAVSARTYTLDGFDAEDKVNATFCYAQGIGHAVLSWTAGARKVLYTLHGTKGAIFVEDVIVRVLPLDRSGVWPDHLAETGSLVTIDSHWKEASRGAWFTDMFAGVVAAINQNALVGRDARNAVECINAIGSQLPRAVRWGRRRRQRPRPRDRRDCLWCPSLSTPVPRWPRPESANHT